MDQRRNGVFNLENQLTDLDSLEILAERVRIVTWQGRQALRLENGLALLSSQSLVDGCIEVWIGVDQAAYPGIVFRATDVANFELAYPVPHVSGQWDALQYDPIFHGSNTWQVYHGPGYQRATDVPTGRWFQFKAEFCGSRAAFSIDNQPPLVVERLAHPVRSGRLGLWTFRPAHFCNLRVTASDERAIPPGQLPDANRHAVRDWFVESYGLVSSEPNGVVNLNRYLPASLGQVRLTRQFELSAAGEVAFEFGFSDVLCLELDGQEIFQEENTFTGFQDRANRGYAELGTHAVRQALTPGQHRLVAELELKEPFGWGWVLAAHGEGLRWLPAELG
jgi:hypothetical protein